MDKMYRTICGVAGVVMGAVMLAGCTSSPRVAQFDYVRPDQCLCTNYGVACKYHSPVNREMERKTLIADTRK